jgi:hypothetical protein
VPQFSEGFFNKRHQQQTGSAQKGRSGSFRGGNREEIGTDILEFRKK